LEDATLLIKKEKVEESKRSEATGQLYNSLLSYVQKLKQGGAIERNLLCARSLANKIHLETLFSNTKLKSELRPQNIVRFIEKALKGQRAIVNLEQREGQGAGASQLDSFKVLGYEFTEMFYNTLIKYYIGLHYANENSFEEAFAILHRVQHVDIEETIEFAKRNNLNKGGLIKKDLAELEETLLPNLSYLLCKSHAKILEK
jgi:hypothetical protein